MGLGGKRNGAGGKERERDGAGERERRSWGEREREREMVAKSVRDVMRPDLVREWRGGT